MKKIIPNIWAYIVIVLAAFLVALLFLWQIWPINWLSANFVKPYISIDDGDHIPSTYLSVMIDNSLDARPQFGLEKAVIVYEALIEGGFTRMMAVFNENDLPEVVGPVRSARPYFVDWANDWSGSYWHAGGSPQALHMLKYDNLNFVNIDEISYQGKYFYRNNYFSNPHNLFTDSESIGIASIKYEIEEEIDYLWDTKDELEYEYRTDEQKYIHIPYTQPTCDVVWNYDRQTNSWQRYVNEQQQYYVDGEAVAVKNVIVLLLDTRLIDVERLGMDTVGTGSGYLFRDGQKQEIVWSKQGADTNLEFLSGQRQIQLNNGRTWIQILPSYLNFEYN
jgi:Protein of unknown function (DUF3048) N-terminal domain/Protein of unknown function (DUF3048) C-terminal domain